MMLQDGRDVLALTALGPSNSCDLIGKDGIQANREDSVELHVGGLLRE